VNSDSKERWMQLCEQAAIEQDPKKLLELVAEINRVLEKREDRLKDGNLSTSSAAD
jgi:hypothetical protein